MKKMLVSLSIIAMIQTSCMMPVSCKGNGMIFNTEQNIYSKPEEFLKLKNYLIARYTLFKNHEDIEEKVYNFYSGKRAYTFDKNWIPNQKGYYVQYSFLEDSENFYNLKVTLTDIIKVDDGDEYSDNYKIDELNTESKVIKIQKNKAVQDILLDMYLYNISDKDMIYNK
ncbi:hypothetical protein SHELI_v1c04490 [Spiroplasma helicoides]|uniref:Lipoprotein n=1 Tax=Spiroplasma helicoides TaxID=216938 RepID=A0A1B3SKE9_9MOLU|nr:hypothetical protein [Spiroplasma helicoides]AOG60400.1 hypothetical protein SHELI_v1c04490 [Spiroplasma helicoides]